MVDLIRNVIVSDHGNARQFLKGPVPSNIGPGTLDRLRRAGGLAPEAVVKVVSPAPEEAPALSAPKGKAK
ncbi:MULTISPECIES: hypothetical protein [unclassified Mesorhizobium]|uniref:hypothetical protein n=1 Tax=unclassified Mesorhizobium TaxID=325217 RepID=UPI003339E55D